MSDLREDKPRRYVLNPSVDWAVKPTQEIYIEDFLPRPAPEVISYIQRQGREYVLPSPEEIERFARENPEAFRAGCDLIRAEYAAAVEQDAKVKGAKRNTPGYLAVLGALEYVAGKHPRELLVGPGKWMYFEKWLPPDWEVSADTELVSAVLAIALLLMVDHPPVNIKLPSIPLAPPPRKPGEPLITRLENRRGIREAIRSVYEPVWIEWLAWAWSNRMILLPVSPAGGGGTQPNSQGSKTTTVVLWEGAEHTERNVKLARTRTAYLEAHGDVSEALKALNRDDCSIGQSTFYEHLNKLDQETPGWRGGVRRDSGPSGKSEIGGQTGIREKHRGKSR